MASNEIRLIPTPQFLRHYLITFASRKPLVISAIEELQNGYPVVEEYSDGSRSIIHHNCKIYFENDVLLDFEFV